MASFDILIPLDQNQRRAWIKYQLDLRGISLGDIGREHGVTRAAARLALVKPYPRMERVIAEKIGLLPQTIWPERYNELGLPNRRLGRPPESHVNKDKHIITERRRNVKDRRAK